MTIDTDVREVAQHWGIDAALLQAVVNAEGNIVKAIKIDGITTRDEALKVLARSATHAMSDYIKQTQRQAFIAYWAGRWAPVGAANDPHGLNKNWPVNVLALWS